MKTPFKMRGWSPFRQNEKTEKVETEKIKKGSWSEITPHIDALNKKWEKSGANLAYLQRNNPDRGRGATPEMVGQWKLYNMDLNRILTSYGRKARVKIY
tara:strand:+ start:1234 stop:1530 length:297 start_codon:yes stop_codon:yes gene_type:complete